MHLLPKLEALPGESMTSYLNRVARFHGNVPLPKFLDMIELPRQELLATSSETIERVSRLTGLQTVQLERMTFLLHEKAMRRIGGHVVHTEFLDAKARRFCPACLLEDLAPDSPSLGVPVGRIGWQIHSIQTCSRHGLLLEHRSIRTYSDRFKNLPEFFENEAELHQLVSSAKECKASALQSYVLKRIAGVKGPDWLDAQPLDRAVRTCELLGMLLIDLPRAVPEKLAPSQRNLAADKGYRYASAGVIGMNEAFHVLFDRYVEREQPGGAQKVFGHFYTWLQRQQHNRDPGPVRDLLREFVLDHFPVEEGAELLGAPVDRQRVHTTRTLAAKSEFHLKTVRRALVAEGLVADAEGNWPLHQVFDAKAGQAVVEKMQASISTKGLEVYLNCTRGQAEQLTRSGTIPRLVPVGEACSGVLTNVAREDADAFLTRIMGSAVEVAMPSEGFLDISGAAEVLHRPALDIVATILDGLLTRVETFDPRNKFKSLYVHPEDVRRAMSYNPPTGFMTVDQASGKLGLPPESIYALSGLGGADGKPFFSEHFFDNSGSAKQRMISAEEVTEFSKRYITLKEYSEMMGIDSRSASKKLTTKGISTIASRRAVLRAIYDRQEVFELVDS
ncbi:TniQ family protein [Celeribacter ethanolicus]|uniref:TniQ family protein n=1 Tax=Celeribacter ethanolicus TaxID=1758178 RepID=UPI00082B102E|nr:TniQ family protein [Celeribacter ethanolicus]